MVTTALQAQVRSNDATITMMNNCSTDEPAYESFGGCPEGAPFPGSKSYKGDVTLTEFFRLLFSPLAQPSHVIGHPSWRNEPSYISFREGQTVRVVNRGGRVHTFTRRPRKLQPVLAFQEDGVPAADTPAHCITRRKRSSFRIGSNWRPVCTWWKYASADARSSQAFTSQSSARSN
jgi:hypothetical protein